MSAILVKNTYVYSICHLHTNVCTQCLHAVDNLKLLAPFETRDERNQPVNLMIDRPCPIAATAPVSMPSLSDDFLRAESSRLIGRRKPRQLSPLLYLTEQKQRPGIRDRGNERGWSRYGRVVVVVAACLGSWYHVNRLGAVLGLPLSLMGSALVFCQWWRSTVSRNSLVSFYLRLFWMHKVKLKWRWYRTD